MKIRKLWLLPILLLGLVLAGCSNKSNTKKSATALTKTQVVQKAKKSFKSGQVIQSVRLATDTSTQLVTANTIFSGNNGTIFHITNQTTSKGKTQSTEEWVNMNNVFINGSSTWYKAKLDSLSGHSYAELVNAIMDNKLILDPSSKLVKAYKMTRKGQTYTLTANLTDKTLMKNASEPIIATVGQTSAQESVFRRILNYGKLKNMTVKMVVKNNKLSTFTVFVNLKLGKYMTARFGQSYGNFGSQDFLKVPTSVLNAKALPTTKSSKKSSK